MSAAIDDGNGNGDNNGFVVDPEATPADVAALLTARTKDRAGNELGHWSDETRPTEPQVQARIDIARSLVLDGFTVIPDPCRASSESCVALLAAMLTEAAFFPEQTASNQSTYQRLADLYAQASAGLAACVEGYLSYSAYDLDTSGCGCGGWPPDWFQRDLDNRIALSDAIRDRRLRA